MRQTLVQVQDSAEQQSHPVSKELQNGANHQLSLRQQADPLLTLSRLVSFGNLLPKCLNKVRRDYFKTWRVEITSKKLPRNGSNMHAFAGAVSLHKGPWPTHDNYWTSLLGLSSKASSSATSAHPLPSTPLLVHSNYFCYLGMHSTSVTTIFYHGCVVSPSKCTQELK